MSFLLDPTGWSENHVLVVAIVIPLAFVAFVVVAMCVAASRDSDRVDEWEDERARAEEFESISIARLLPTESESAEVLVAAESFTREAGCR